MSGAEGPAVHADIHGGQGHQVGNHNVMLNVWLQSDASAAGATGPVVAGEIPQEPAAFLAREQLLGALRSGGPGTPVTAVTGMRGTGKTQLAGAFARECAAAGWRLVGWVDARDSASMLAGLAVVAARLGIARAASATDAAEALRDRLSADGDSCLLVLDDAPDLEAVSRYLPAAGKSRVVVTTTGQLADVRAAVVPVGLFSEAEALGFLAQRTGLADERGAQAVAEELGWLPLALAQAGAVIAGQRLPYLVYLARLQQVPVDEQQPTGPGAARSRGLAEAVLLSLDAVAVDGAAGQMCRRVLDLVAVVSPAGVSRSLLYGAVREPVGGLGLPVSQLVDEAAGRLAGGSLLTFSGDGDSVAAHRLVMRVVRERAQREGTLTPLGMQACQMLGSAMGALEQPWENRTAAREVIGHVVALHEHVRPCLDDSPELQSGLLALRRRALSWLIMLDDPSRLTAEQGRSVIADCARMLGHDHPDTLKSRDHVAAAQLLSGQAAEALPALEATAADCERVLGHDHPDTLKCRQHLAGAQMLSGRPGEAVALYEATLSDSERVLGHDHPDTLKCRANLAAAYRAAGRMSEAITLYQATLSDCERVLGHDHPDRLKYLFNLATSYLMAERFLEALPLLEITLADWAQELGRDHPSTMKCCANLAAAYRGVGRMGEAITLYQATLADRERVLGHDHPDTLACRGNLIAAYRAADRLAEAVALCEATLADRERVLGHDHADTLRSRHDLGLAYRAAGRLGEAVPLLEAALCDHWRLLGPDHLNTLMCRNNLGLGYREAGRLGEAIPLLESTLADYCRILGRDQPDTLACCHNLALGYRDAGWAGRAIPLLEANLADRERVLGRDHPHTLVSRRALEETRRMVRLTSGTGMSGKTTRRSAPQATGHPGCRFGIAKPVAAAVS